MGESVLHAISARLHAVVAITATLLLAALTLSLPSAVAATFATEADVDVEFVSASADHGSWTEMRGTWSLGKNPTTPAGFRLEFPAGQLRGLADTFPMLDDADEPMGECVVDEAGITCTVDPAYVKANPLDLHGEFNYWVQIVETVTQDTAKKYEISGIEADITVTLPDEWCTSSCTFVSRETAKFGEYRPGTDPDTIEWSIDLKTDRDGMNGESVEIVEDLGANQTVNSIKVIRSNTLGVWPYANYEVWTDWKDVDPADFDVTVNADGDNVITFVAERGWAYAVKINVNVADNGASVNYRNNATVKIGTEVPTEHREIVTFQGGSASGIGTNVGRFTITKRLAGATTGLPAQTFSGTYTVTSPDSTEVDGTWSVEAGDTWTSPDFPRGSTVVLTEDAPVAPASIRWSHSFSDNNFPLPGGQHVPITLTNDAELRTGAVQILKELDGTAAARSAVPAGHTFEIDYTYPAGPGYAAGGGMVSVKADGAAVTTGQIPLGAQVTFAERTPAALPGVAWGAPVISPSTVTVADSGPARVVVSNPVRETLGGFSLVKRVTGAGAARVPAGAEFEVDYAWRATNPAAQGSGSVTLRAGEAPVEVADVPEGAVVTLTERAPSPVTGAEWLPPVFSTNGFTVTGGTIVAVDLDNPTALAAGRFEVAKTLTGSGAPLVDRAATFTVEYSYPAGADFAAGSGTLEVAADGKAVQSPALPDGAEVTLSEVAPAAVTGATWGSPAFSQTTLRIGGGQSIAVSLTNRIELQTAAFTVRKQLSGSGAASVPAGTPFVVRWSHPEGKGFAAGSGVMSVPAGGEAKSPELPHGAVVSFSEETPAPIAGLTWGTPAFAPSTLSVTGGAATSNVVLTNPVETVPATTPPTETAPTVAPSTSSAPTDPGSAADEAQPEVKGEEDAVDEEGSESKAGDEPKAKGGSRILPDTGSPVDLLWAAGGLALALLGLAVVAGGVRVRRREP